MARRLRMMALLGIGLGWAAAALADDLETVEKKIKAAWEKQTSMTAKLKMSTNMELGAVTIDGTGEGLVEFLRSGEKIYGRSELKATMTQKMGETEQKVEQSVLTVIDGEFMYTLSEIQGQKTAVKNRIDLKMSGEPKAMIEEFRKDYELKLLPEETVEGAKAFVIEGTAKDKAPMKPSRLILYFHQDSGFFIKMVMFGERDRPMTTMTHSDLKLDVKLDPDHFKFKVPEGVNLIDQTTAAAPDTRPSKSE